MIAIFSNKEDAQDYSEKVHAHLLANRLRYNAVRWSVENKSNEKNEWAVKIPPDLDELKIKMEKHDLSKSIRMIEKYPDKREGNISDVILEKP